MKFTGERFIPGIEEYDKTPMAYEHWQRYYSTLSHIKSKVVIDIACGEGYGSNLMAESAGQVYGVDISKETIHHAEKKYVRNNLTFSQGSVEKLDFDDNTIDVVISFETIEHVNLEAQYLFITEVKRVLKKDGILILSCPNKRVASDYAFDTWGYRNEFHVKEHYIDEFSHFLKSFFEHVNFSYQRYETVLILSSENATSMDIILKNQSSFEHAQNMIVICSQFEVGLSLKNSIVLEEPGTYLELTRNLAGAEKHINLILTRIETLEKQNGQLQGEKDKLREIVELLSMELDQAENTSLIMAQENITLLTYKKELERLLNTRSLKLMNRLFTMKQKIKNMYKRGK
ncbi:putative SAM-dependent methyltransferase [Paenibacillus agaridevorans]|uniref:Putative SAM-dependent methyltransferase n=1 Tax=Paenibacillus agaridevorans TaxID=171404 RepID=A0A2R5EN56_9BACL|nr:class I SAM-dependent methyltransferase [Paenibacillus agaridevorans]GBG07997.1 putative SAM-dependent methyltransferase [Paenibacillus agaridevorans]